MVAIQGLLNPCDDGKAGSSIMLMSSIVVGLVCQGLSYLMSKIGEC